MLAIAVSDLEKKEAILASFGPAAFTIPHFDGYPAVLVQLDAVPHAVQVADADLRLRARAIPRR